MSDAELTRLYEQLRNEKHAQEVSRILGRVKHQAAHQYAAIGLRLAIAATKQRLAKEAKRGD